MEKGPGTGMGPSNPTNPERKCVCFGSWTMEGLEVSSGVLESLLSVCVMLLAENLVCWPGVVTEGKDRRKNRRLR